MSVCRSNDGIQMLVIFKHHFSHIEDWVLGRGCFIMVWRVGYQKRVLKATTDQYWNKYRRRNVDKITKLAQPRNQGKHSEQSSAYRTATNADRMWTGTLSLGCRRITSGHEGDPYDPGATKSLVDTGFGRITQYARELFETDNSQYVSLPYYFLTRQLLFKQRYQFCWRMLSFMFGKVKVNDLLKKHIILHQIISNQLSGGIFLSFEDICFTPTIF